MTMSKKKLLGVTHLFTAITILWLLDIGIRTDVTDSKRSKQNCDRNFSEVNLPHGHLLSTQ